ncbi:hypothetical protein Peur_066956 [Populus x canadensis]
MRHRCHQCVDDFWVPRGCLGCPIHASPGCLGCRILASPGLFGLSNPCVARAISSLMISESLGAVWAVHSMRHP